MRNKTVNETIGSTGRRLFMVRSATLTLSAASVAMLAGRPLRANPGGAGRAESDVKILGSALGAEYVAVAAYDLGANSGLLDAPVLNVARTFRGHHQAHAEVLATTIRKLGGEPADPQPHYEFPLDKLNSQSDVLEFAAGLERGAVSAYAAAIPQFENRELSAAAASILADEAMHWSILRQALGLDPVPRAFFS